MTTTKTKVGSSYKGLNTIIAVDDAFNETHVSKTLSTAQVDTILAECQRDVENFTKFSDGFYKAARIPILLFQEYHQRTGVDLLKGGYENEAIIDHLLNTDWAPFKTIPGTI